MDVFLTVKFKLHNPSQRRKALLLDAMKRTHLGYDKLLKAVEPDVRATIGPPSVAPIPVHVSFSAASNLF